MTPKRPAHGKGYTLTLVERQQAAQLVAAGASIAAVARQLGCARGTVYNALRGHDGMKEAYDVRAALKERRELFVKCWVRAAEVAAERGDHRPSARALEVLGDVQPQVTPTMQVSIGFSHLSCQFLPIRLLCGPSLNRRDQVHYLGPVRCLPAA